ncbi:MAG: hypothetical protein O9284_02675 [Steroidobacteraceae bacterium]|jgi:hypothetical protein|nr:hypothetical protein [Steroidobacteraceae bacterium]
MRTTTVAATLVAALVAALALPGAVLAHGSHAQPKDGAASAPPPSYVAGAPRWWKGNTHTHSWWSDGDSPPETIAAWYRERGWHFLVFSEHNRMAEGESWYPVNTDQKRDALALYRTQFGSEWVVERTAADGTPEVKLKALDEFRTLFEAPGQFAFIKGQEITDRFFEHPVHLNGVNLEKLVIPQGGDSIAQMIQRNVDAVVEQGRRTGRPTFVHVNHPNFHYAITVEDLLPLKVTKGDGFFEVYNGHPGVRNEGDATRPSMERMWDILLAKRLGELGLEPIYGIATDDSHEYTRWGVGEVNPGRGWIMVRSARLTPDSISAAIRRGDFYASTGVTLEEVQVGPRTLTLEVEPQPGVEYRIEFVGTRRGVDLAGRPVETPATAVQPANERWRQSLHYDERIGTVLRTVNGTRASYELRGDEIYVRARVVSTKPHPNPYRAGDVEMAWTQPLVPPMR